jgi:hypothetical protein
VQSIAAVSHPSSPACDSHDGRTAIGMKRRWQDADCDFLNRRHESRSFDDLILAPNGTE